MKFCIKTIGRNRFSEILNLLRFDFKDTRSHLLITDNLNTSLKSGTDLLKNPFEYFTSGENTTIDKQLIFKKKLLVHLRNLCLPKQVRTD